MSLYLVIYETSEGGTSWDYWSATNEVEAKRHGEKCGKVMEVALVKRAWVTLAGDGSLVETPIAGWAAERIR